MFSGRACDGINDEHNTLFGDLQVDPRRGGGGATISLSLLRLHERENVPLQCASRQRVEKRFWVAAGERASERALPGRLD